ncbi:amidophosphoribosyltransferase [Shimia abyssi]|uniref:Type IV pilus biogenesis protein PilP n=1 Tax=Shimia abyssi TaxID=1662395 RepID=A0A2P8FFC0_9RHOB|nr:amidophosphoribosyltransferase [Shimia abyssi]PSL20417.1 hypothetical protein CLV88_10358 [Shimia abyssi]
MNSETPAAVAAKATRSGALKNRGRVTLIGLMGTAEAPSALLMTTSGRTIKVTLGDKTPGGRVVGIDQVSIVLQSGQKNTRLTMPD